MRLPADSMPLALAGEIVVLFDGVDITGITTDLDDTEGWVKAVVPAGDNCFLIGNDGNPVTETMHGKVEVKLKPTAPPEAAAVLKLLKGELLTRDESNAIKDVVVKELEHGIRHATLIIEWISDASDEAVKNILLDRYMHYWTTVRVFEGQQ